MNRYRHDELKVEKIVQCIEKGQSLHIFELCDVLYTIWLLLMAYPGFVCRVIYDNGPNKFYVTYMEEFVVFLKKVPFFFVFFFNFLRFKSTENTDLFSLIG